MEEKKAKSEKVGVGAWIALIVLILILSGAFRTMDGPIKVLDFTNLSGAFGTIGDTGANLIGSGGTGAKDLFHKPEMHAFGHRRQGRLHGWLQPDPRRHVLLRPAGRV